MEVSIIPIQNLPDQKFVIDLDGQECEMRVYTRFGNTYMDMTLDDKVLFKGQICLNLVDVMQYTHYGFSGQIMFVDTQGWEDPYYDQFNDRWYLVYVQ